MSAPPSSASSRVALELQHVDVRFGGAAGLRDLSLTLRAGEHLGLLGPSGVGKTSLLRSIAGLSGIGAGRIVVAGRDVTAEVAERRGVVYLHQTPALFPHLSVLDNVGFPMEVRGVSRKASRERAQTLLERVQLGSYASRAPGGLSGGQRHRVALARALAAQPSVLLLDEPFAALDPELRADVRAAVFELLRGPDARRAGDKLVDDRDGYDASAAPAVIIVTHDIDEAVALTDRVVVLLDGAVAHDSSPSELLRRPRSLAVARFLGLPNIVPGALDAHGTWISALGSFAMNGSQPSDAATQSTFASAGSAAGAKPAWLVSRADAFEVSDDADAGASTGDLDRTCGSTGVVVSIDERVGGTTVRVRVGDIEVTAVPAREMRLSVGSTARLRMLAARTHLIVDDV